MAANSNIDDYEPIDSDETTNILDHDTGGQSSGCRRRLLFFLGKLFLFVGCLAYNLYLIWLVAYLKDNPFYWFLSLIPLTINLMVIYTAKKGPAYFGFRWRLPLSLSVVWTLMPCFTMLTRVAYYHRQPDQLIGPQFIIFSLQGSVILILLDCFIQKEGKVKELLNSKDALTRMLLDFVDIFNMVEILSANECVGLGSFVSEDSSTEKAIQAFCTMSFVIVVYSLDILPTESETHHRADSDVRDFQYSAVLTASCVFQNIPFLVIRIAVWVRYNFFHLGFLVKNALAIFYYIVYCLK